jgi:hypothetical protein
MTQLTESKELHPILIDSILQKMASRELRGMHQCGRSSWSVRQERDSRQTPPKERIKHLTIEGVVGVNATRQRATQRPVVLACLKVLRVPQPSCRWFMRRVRAFEFHSPRASLQKPSGALSASALSLQSSARLPHEGVRSVASLRQLPVHSGSTLRLHSRKRCGGLFQTNLPSLQWSASSWLINLLVVRPAITVYPGYPTGSKQGPQRPGTAVPVPNSFLLRPSAFRHARPHGVGGYTVRGSTAESALFMSDLRTVAFLLFIATIALLRHFRATQRIVQFNDRTFHPRRNLRNTHANGLTKVTCKPMREFASSQVLNGSTPVDFFSIGSRRARCTNRGSQFAAQISTQTVPSFECASARTQQQIRRKYRSHFASSCRFSQWHTPGYDRARTFLIDSPAIRNGCNSKKTNNGANSNRQYFSRPRRALRASRITYFCARIRIACSRSVCLPLLTLLK